MKSLRNKYKYHLHICHYFSTIKHQIHRLKKVNNLKFLNLRNKIYYLNKYKNIKNLNLLIQLEIKKFNKDNYFVMFLQIMDKHIIIQKIHNISQINLINWFL